MESGSIESSASLPVTEVRPTSPAEMNLKVFVFFLFALTLMAPVFAGDKDDDTIIIGEHGQILYKGGGKKVSLKQLIESLQITLTVETYVRTTIRSSSRGEGAAFSANGNPNSTSDSGLLTTVSSL